MNELLELERELGPLLRRALDTIVPTDASGFASRSTADSIPDARQDSTTVTLAVDVGRINYSDVASVSNPTASPAPLGAPNGPGFGWKDIDVFKLGVAWRMSDALTLRAGYNKGGNPISPANVTFNIIAPGVTTQHYTAGFTLATGQASEISGALMVAPRQTVTGPSLFNAVLGPGAGGNETIGMKQTSIGLAWSRKF